MRRREFIAGALVFCVPDVASSQQARRTVRLAYLAPGRNQRLLDALVGGLRDLGYVRDDNLILEYRSAEGQSDRLAALAGEIAQSSPHVIVTLGSAAARAARRATPTIPIVFAPGGDAVESGLVQSLARPAGNLTGLSINTWILNEKRLEILKEMFADIRRVAVLGNAGNPSGPAQWERVKERGPALGLELVPILIDRVAGLASGFATMARERIDALAVLPDATFDTVRDQIVALAAEHRLRTIYEHRAFAEAGGLMSYGPNLDQISYRAAYFVDRILKGTPPADLPVEQPTTFEFIVNLKTAKALGLAVPPPLLARADEVIE